MRFAILTILVASIVAIGCSQTRSLLKTDFEGIPNGSIENQCGAGCDLPGPPDGDEMSHIGGLVRIDESAGESFLVIHQKPDESNVPAGGTHTHGIVEFDPVDRGGGGSSFFVWDGTVVENSGEPLLVSAQVASGQVQLYFGPESLVVLHGSNEGQQTEQLDGTVAGNHKVAIRIDRATGCFGIEITGPDVEPNGNVSFGGRTVLAPWNGELKLTLGSTDLLSLADPPREGFSNYVVHDIETWSTKPFSEDEPRSTSTPCLTSD